MGRVGTVTLAIIAVALGLGLAAQAVHHARLTGELDEVKTRLEKLERRPKETPSSADSEERGALLERSRTPKSPSSGETPAPAAPGVASALPLSLTPEELQKIVDERVEEKLQARLPQKADSGSAMAGDRKMPLHDMAKELALEPESQAKVSEIANAAKREIFDIVRTPRADGTNFADELIDVMLKGDQPGAQKLFQRLFTEKIPGTDTAYVMAVAGIQERANLGLQAAMGDPAYQRYLNMNVHPENIETGFDPWAQYIRTRAGK